MPTAGGGPPPRPRAPRVPGGPLVVPLPAPREGVEGVGAVEGLEVVLGDRPACFALRPPAEDRGGEPGAGRVRVRSGAGR